MPEELPLLNSLAVLFSRIQKFDDALQLLSKAVQINPEDPLSWFNLGVAFEAKGDLKGAESAYRQALLLQPDLDRASEYLQRVSKN
jgi:Flp pilus assembly protein TadD